MATHSIRDDSERVVRRREMEDYVELQMVEWVNRGIRNHIRKCHPIRWQWIRLKAHWKTTLDLARSENPAAKHHIWNAVKEFFKSEEGKPRTLTDLSGNGRDATGRAD